MFRGVLMIRDRRFEEFFRLLRSNGFEVVDNRGRVNDGKDIEIYYDASRDLGEDIDKDLISYENAIDKFKLDMSLFDSNLESKDFLDVLKRGYLIDIDRKRVEEQLSHVQLKVVDMMSFFSEDNSFSFTKNSGKSLLDDKPVEVDFSQLFDRRVYIRDGGKGL